MSARNLMYEHYYGQMQVPTATVVMGGGHNTYFTNTQPVQMMSGESSPVVKKDVIVGNLSYFCEEKDLLDLFEPYADVTQVRIMRSDKNPEKINRSLLYGFVTFGTPHEAKEMATLMDGTVFMGRKLRISLCRENHDPSLSNSTHQEGLQLYVTFSSKFYFHGPQSHIVCPTEQLLRKVFVKYGTVLDVSVKSYVVHEMVQQGFGFVTFASTNAASCVPPHIAYKGIHFQCSLTHKQNSRPSSLRRQQELAMAQQQVLHSQPAVHQPVYASSQRQTLSPTQLWSLSQSYNFSSYDQDSCSLSLAGTDNESLSSSRPISLTHSVGVDQYDPALSLDYGGSIEFDGDIHDHQFGHVIHSSAALVSGDD